MKNIRNIESFGSKQDFCIEVGIWIDEKNNKDIYNTLKMYIAGKNILEYKRYNKIMTYIWDTFEGILDWFLKNLEYIIKEDKFPFEIKGNSASEKCFNFTHSNQFLKDNIETEEELEHYENVLEIYQSWRFRHSWLTSRRGSILADVFFRRINDKIEISWNNYELFKTEEVQFVYLKGVYFVDVEKFLYVVTKFLEYCRDIT